ETTLELTVSTQTNISEDLNFETTIGAQSFWTQSRDNFTGTKDYPVTSVEILNGGTVVTGVDESFKEVISAGAFLQEKISFKNNLFLTGSVRLDGNSTFGDNLGFQV